MSGHRRPRWSNRKALLTGSHGCGKPLVSLVATFRAEAAASSPDHDGGFPAAVLSLVDGPLAIAAFTHPVAFLTSSSTPKCRHGSVDSALVKIDRSRRAVCLDMVPLKATRSDLQP